jgi:isopenicillin N synthase-like dioxygenase
MSIPCGSCASCKRSNALQLIDFSPFLHGTPEEKAAVGKAVVEGFRTAGFLYLENHGITPAQTANMFKQSAKFFEMPQEEKDKLEWYSPAANRGYSGHGKEKVSLAEMADKVQELREQVPDLKESIEIGRDDEEEYPNMWPPANYGPEGWSESFKTDAKEFFDTCKRFHMEIMRAIAVGLGIDEGWFDGFTDQGDNTLRLLHYPGVKREVFERNDMQVRAGVHSDYGMYTV